MTITNQLRSHAIFVFKESIELHCCKDLLVNLIILFNVVYDLLDTLRLGPLNHHSEALSGSYGVWPNRHHTLHPPKVLSCVKFEHSADQICPIRVKYKNYLLILSVLNKIVNSLSLLLNPSQL